MQLSRRKFLSMVNAALASLSLHGMIIPRVLADHLNNEEGNFRFIYRNPQLREEFLKFLKNVFHLYPQDRLDELLAAAVEKIASDQGIYVDVQQQLGDIKAFLSDLRYALPALNKQKEIMAEQAVALLGDKTRYASYLEVGSTGRYLDSLEEILEIQEERYFVSDKPATYSLSDMLDRGQISEAGKTIGLDGYRVDFQKNIPTSSVSLATVYIGFHHCPLDLREAFITGIRDVMKPGASLILRDHDVHDKNMWHMVALAHDVFNMGTDETWDYNHNELRNFYSLEYLDGMLQQYGFKSKGEKLYQQGDPTLNALMLYKKA
jgi:hypothetical protein